MILRSQIPSQMSPKIRSPKRESAGEICLVHEKVIGSTNVSREGNSKSLLGKVGKNACTLRPNFNISKYETPLAKKKP